VFADKLGPAVFLANVLKQAQIEGAGLFGSGEHQDKRIFAQHLEWAMTKGGAAHTLRREVIRFLYDQSANLYGSQRRSSSDKKEVSGATQCFGECLRMIAPVVQVIAYGGANSLEFFAALAQTASAEQITEPFQGHETSEVGLARDGEFLASTRDD